MKKTDEYDWAEDAVASYALAIQTLRERYLADRLPGESAKDCLLYTSPSPRDATLSRMPSSA